MPCEREKMLGGKRIVMAAELWFGCTGASIVHGLRAQGWDVCEVDTRNFFSRSATLLSKAMSRLTRTQAVRAYNDAILEAVEQVQPHAFITVKGMAILPETLREFARRGVVAINYYPDVHFDHEALRPATLPLYRFIFTTKSFQVPYLESLLDPERVALLHHGYSDCAHYPRLNSVSDDDYLADVTYVGNYAPYKEQWLGAIARRLPGVRLRVIGSRWQVGRDAAVKKCAVGHVMSGDFYARAIQLSRINLAFHGGPTGPQNWADLVSTRTFEIPACRGFMLHIDNPEVRTLFEPTNEIGVFADEDELIGEITHYLERPARRRDMIERSYRRCVPCFGYDARAETISDEIELLSSALGGLRTGIAARPKLDKRAPTAH